jgi:Kef-type K+ transport system membrane component KefB
VLGELIAGVILGNLVLVGVPFFEPIQDSEILQFLAELGVIVLLFQIGLESDLAQMSRVGVRASLVAVVGVVLPFVLGTWLAGPLLLPGLDFNGYLFIGAALTATSVGITARVFRDLGRLQLPEARIVLGAAVIDDVLGLIILAVVSAIVTTGSVGFTTVAAITGKALLFLVAATVLGKLLAPVLGRAFSRVDRGRAAKVTLAFSAALLLAYAAGAIGLAPIVGAFAAGLILDPIHFVEFEPPPVASDLRASIEDADPVTRSRIEGIADHLTNKHVEELLDPIGFFLVPIFFVLTGMAVDLTTFADRATLLTALGITVVAIFGKVVAGVVAGNVNRWLVGWGMVPRGEVGLIFASIGFGLGVVNDEVYSVIVLMVIFTTLLTPPILSFLLRREGTATAQPANA